jgi:hypothetical protein
VVAAVVLDVEVTVRRLGERHLGEPTLVGLPLVAQLVCGVDADAADAADRDGQADLVDEAQVEVTHQLGEGAVRERVLGAEEVSEPGERVAHSDHVHRRDQHEVLDRQVEVGDPAVVLVVLQRLDDVVGRVGGVETEDQVQDRDDAEDHDRADPQDRREVELRVGDDGDDAEARDEEAEQPQVALLVLPVLRGPLRDGTGGRIHHRRASSACRLQKHVACKVLTQRSHL